MAVFYQEKFVRDIVKEEMQNGIAELLRNATLQGISLRSRGTWVSGREYVNNSQFIDMVYYAKTGCTYTCSATHHSSRAITPDNETYWALMSSKGDTGADAQSVFVSTVFIAAGNTVPATPTGGSFNDPIPDGDDWSDGIPGRTTDNPTIYMSKRKFTSDGVGQDSAWSTPVVAYDSQYTDICFHPAKSDGSVPAAPTKHGSQGVDTSTWHDTGNSNDVWMAISYRDMRSKGWSAWSISKIKGEKGDEGDTPVPSMGDDGLLSWKWKRNTDPLELPSDKCLMGPTMVPSVNESTGVMTWSKITNPLSIPSNANVKGPQGATGDTWVPSVDSDGNLSWSKNATTTPSTQKIKGEDGHSPVLTWSGTTLLIDGENGVDLKGPKGDTGAQGLQGARGTRWFTVPQGSFDYSSVGGTGGILFTNILEIQSGIATKADIQVGDKVKMAVLGYTADVTSVVITQGIIVKYDGGNIRGAQGETGATGDAGSDGLSVEYVGKFVEGVLYLVGDCVTLSNTNENNEFICIKEHTSSSNEIVDLSIAHDGSGNRLSTEYWELKRANTGSRRSVIDTIIKNYEYH